MDENYGLTLIKLPAGKINPSELYKNIPYSEFEGFIKTQKLYSSKEITEILNS